MIARMFRRLKVMAGGKKPRRRPTGIFARTAKPVSHGTSVEFETGSPDPAETISNAVRGLRVRYISVILAFVALCGLLVAGGHYANARFSYATSMAVLIADATDTTERVSRLAMEIMRDDNADTINAKAALKIQAERLDEVNMSIVGLWQQLPGDLQALLYVDTSIGKRGPATLLKDLKTEAIAVSRSQAGNNISVARRLDVLAGSVVYPALARQAAALRTLNRGFADRSKLAINIIGTVFWLFAASILFFIFMPMERSISAALAKLKAALEAAKTSERAKSEFLANMSHEIRTPMNGVLGMAELMAQTELDQRQKTFTDVIVKSGNALLTIINDILDFSKIDAGHIELDPAPFNLREAVEDVATLISSRVAEKDLELVVRVDPALPGWVVGDVGRLRQILTNLTGNAVKFTERGHVLIEVSGEDDMMRIAVTDTGIGVPEDKLASVFEKFSQVDTSSTRRHEGTGLGLAIASRLVELMEGKFGAQSKLGEGSTFWFTIPVIEHEALEPVLTPDTDLTGARILIVDDNAINCSIFSEMTRSWGFESCAVESGRLALDFVDHAAAMGSGVDLIILDYQMPDLNGAEVLNALRARPATANVPVLMLTSVDHGLAMRELKLAGATAILTKPTRSNLLLGTIMEHLALARRGADKPLGEKPGPAPQTEMQPPHPDNVVPLPRTPDSNSVSSLDILVAEDNEVNQLVFDQILRPLDYTFRIVGDGRRAVETWKLRRPRMILMDVSMPEMNGFEATKAIREAEAADGSGHTPIIGVTAHALKGDRERCLDSGMDDYITKPISPESMATKLTEWMMKAPRHYTARN